MPVSSLRARWSRVAAWSCALACAMGCAMGCVWPAAAAGAARAPAPLQLEWQSLGDVSDFDAAGKPLPDSRHTRALLRLTNLGSTPLAASGWAIDFSCMAGVLAGAAGEAMQVEQLAGTLYRLRPRAGFAGLAPGAQLEAQIAHEGPVGNPTKGIDGPYYIEDARPSEGHPLARFRALPMPLQPGEVTPAMLYARYAQLQAASPVTLPPVFPAPLDWRAGEGTLRWSSLPGINAPPALAVEARRLRSLLAPCLLYTSPSPRDRQKSRMPSSA